MKYHVSHDFITSTPFEEKSSDHFEDLHKMELLTNFIIIPLAEILECHWSITA